MKADKVLVDSLIIYGVLTFGTISDGLEMVRACGRIRYSGPTADA